MRREDGHSKTLRSGKKKYFSNVVMNHGCSKKKYVLLLLEPVEGIAESGRHRLDRIDNSSKMLPEMYSFSMSFCVSVSFNCSSVTRNEMLIPSVNDYPTLVIVGIYWLAEAAHVKEVLGSISATFMKTCVL